MWIWKLFFLTTADDIWCLYISRYSMNMCMLIFLIKSWLIILIFCQGTNLCFMNSYCTKSSLDSFTEPHIDFHYVGHQLFIDPKIKGMNMNMWNYNKSSKPALIIIPQDYFTMFVFVYQWYFFLTRFLAWNTIFSVYRVHCF